MTSLFFASFQDRIDKIRNKTLDKVDRIIDWNRVNSILSPINKNKLDGKTSGQLPYEPLKMFKAILLQQWHNLSDLKLEESLINRIDFMVFTGFIEDNMNTPDLSTICRFRNKIVELGIDQILQQEINSQIEKLGLKIENADCAIVDATIVESACRGRKRKLDNIVTDRQEEENTDSSLKMETNQKDPDADYTIKRNRIYFGYKLHGVTDNEGFFLNSHITPANKSDIGELEKMIDKLKEGTEIMGDAGYFCKKNLEILENKNMKDSIMARTWGKKQELNEKQKEKNLRIAKTRYIIERSFGTIKRIFHGQRSSYVGAKRTLGQFIIRCICANLLKASNKIVGFV